MSNLSAGGRKQSSGFTENAQSDRSDGVVASTSSSYATKMNFSPTALDGGTYRINCSYTFQLDATAEIDCRAQIDNTTTIHNMRKVGHPAEATTDRFPGAFEWVQSFSPGNTPSIDFDLARASGSGSVRVYETRFSIERIGP